MLRSYRIIVPDDPYLFPSMDLNIRCMEVVRLALPSIIKEGNSTLEYDLFLIHGPYTPEDSKPAYPVFGMYCADEEALASVAALDLENRVNTWINQLGLTELLQRASFIDYVDWKILSEQKVYPLR